MKSGNLTVTDARLLRALQTAGETANNSSNFSGKSSTTEASKDDILRTGVVKKYYMNINRAEVQLTGENTHVTCLVLVPFGDELVLKYAPTGDYEYEPSTGNGYIVPRCEMECIVAKLGENDKFDYVLLGYYDSSTIPSTVPAPGTGNVKLSYVGATDEYFLSFGVGGFNIVASQTNKYVGSVGEYANVNDDYYEKSEVYTKEEVDKLIEDLKEELNPDSTEEDTI